MINKEEESLSLLRRYCESIDFQGWDPFDGLNSKVFNSIALFHNSDLIRLAWIQFFKRCPINLRQLFKINKDYNPKGLGLFLSGYCNLWKIDPKEEYLLIIRQLAFLIIELKSKGWSGACWGYNFDWQARAFFQPAKTPTVVASSFIGNALFDAYDILREKEILDVAVSIGAFVIKDLNRTYDSKGNFSFSYSPLDKTTVYNASLLGARILSRIYSYTKDEVCITLAKQNVQFCIDKQNSDGSWFYSPLKYHQWIDNFHTGFNLECISQYMTFASDFSFVFEMNHGMQFYKQNFFTETGIPKYYHNKLYPIDLHSTAQFILTCSKMGIFNENIELINSVIKWTITNMQSKQGYFYFQKNQFYINKIPYIRWTQAWMFLALTEYLKNSKPIH